MYLRRVFVFLSVVLSTITWAASSSDDALNYEIREIEIKAKSAQKNELRAALADAEDLDDFTRFLRSKGFAFSSRVYVRSTDKLPKAFVEMNEGSAMFEGISTGAKVSFLQKKGVDADSQVTGAAQPPAWWKACEDEAIAIEAQGERDVRSARTEEERRTAKYTEARKQKELFTGRCSKYPNASSFIADANRALGDNNASSATRNGQPPDISQSGTAQAEGQTNGQARPDKVSNQQCKKDILAIHQQAAREVQAAGTAEASKAAEYAQMRRQKDLFTGRCSQYPDAAAYIATADRVLGQSNSSSGRGAVLSSANSQTTFDGARISGSSASTQSSDGRSSCIQLETKGKGAIVKNVCAEKLTVVVCVANQSHWWPCGPSGGLINLRPQASYPVQDLSMWPGQVRWAACVQPATPRDWDGSAGGSFFCK